MFNPLSCSHDMKLRRHPRRHFTLLLAIFVQPPNPPSPARPGCSVLRTIAPFSCLDWTLISLYICLAGLILYGFQMADAEPGSDVLQEPLLTEDRDLDQGESSQEGHLHGAADNKKREDRKQGLDINSGMAMADHQSPSVTENSLGRIFYEYGCMCFSKRWETISLVSIFFLIFAAGIFRLEVVTDPIRLWVGPGSQAAREKVLYESAFGPYYRISQLILSTTRASNSSKITPSGLPAVSTDENIRLLFDMQDVINNISVDGQTLQDICYKPLGDACATQSILEYWGGSRETFEGTSGPRLSPEYCFLHWNTACRASTGAPVNPNVVLGGFPRNGSTSYASEATAFVVTFLLSPNVEMLDLVTEWERKFIAVASTQLKSMAGAKDLSLTFSAERSVEDELKRESSADALAVALSYGVMTIYIACALCIFPQNRAWNFKTIRSRVYVALLGVFLVAFAVVAALGLCGWLRIGATLIIMEVIPFLTLAIGVDNVFLLTRAADVVFKINIESKDIAGLTLAEAGPSILFAAVAQMAGFGIGTLTSMPALRDFAACAAIAIGLNFVLQITIFPSILALCHLNDACEPWLEDEEGEDGDTGVDSTKQNAVDQLNSSWGILPALQYYVSQIHVPFLLSARVRSMVILSFLGMFFFSCALLPRVERGLDQRIALPQDSYLQQYYTDVANLLRVGPPVSFVVQNLKLEDDWDVSDVRKVCSVAGCLDDSLLNRVALSARSPWISYLSGPASSWLDDFISWTSPEIPQCCRSFPNGTACPPPDQPPCKVIDPDEGPKDTGICKDCTSCFSPSPEKGRFNLTVKDFKRFLPRFLEAKPSAECAKGGLGAYNDALQANATDPTGVDGLSIGSISTSSFTAYYLPLSSQQDFIRALDETRRLVESAVKDLDLHIFGYSVFHVFFEQYLTLGGEALVMLGSAFVAIFILSTAFTRSVLASTTLLGVIVILCVDLVGVMVMSGVQMNAIALVNLSAAVGIGVEFSVHILHRFMITQPSWPQSRRMSTAMERTGASVLAGIATTKLIGVLVLSLAKTEIFRIYFFEFYFALVVIGALHGLLFLPPLLGSIGSLI
jgi:Niemann-Pick C1 protein